MKIEIIKTSKRRNVAMQVARDGTVVIKSPTDIDDEKLYNLALEHKDWIEKQLEKLKERKLFKEYKDGEKFLYLGNEYELRIVKQKEPLTLKDGYFYLSDKYLDDTRTVFIKWYKKQAKEIISERVKYYAELGGYKYNKIFFKDLRSKNGSCSMYGNLNFDWKLIMAPSDVIDYMVVHELSHLKEFNHSERFWKLVEALIPDYKEKRKWLKENDYLLNI